MPRPSQCAVCGCFEHCLHPTDPACAEHKGDERYVWIVEYDAYGDRWLHGVYDSEDKVAKFKPKDPERPWSCDYRISKERVR